MSILGLTISYRIIELLLKSGKSSFLRIPDQGPGQAQESGLFKTFWIPAYAGMTKWGYFSKLSKHPSGERNPLIYDSEQAAIRR
jgi:hypothetical protein